jgi:hypothetical protein
MVRNKPLIPSLSNAKLAQPNYNGICILYSRLFSFHEGNHSNFACIITNNQEKRVKCDFIIFYSQIIILFKNASPKLKIRLIMPITTNTQL